MKGRGHVSVAAVKAGQRAYRATLAEALGRGERKGRRIEKIRFLGRSSLLSVDEIGDLQISPGGAGLFFQRIIARYEKGAMVLGFRRGLADLGKVSGDPVVAPRPRRTARSAAA